MKVKTYLFDCDCLKDGAVFDRFLNEISESRRQKINRVASENDKRLSLGAAILLKRALGEYTKKTESLGEHGKPYIEGCPLKYSISHSGRYAFLATAETEVGCDVQEMLPKDFGKISKRFFTEGENALINGENGMFYRLWCIKESYIKMLGTGLSKPLGSFEVKIKNGAPYIDGTCTVKEFELAEGYRFAVCAGGNAEFEETEIITL